MRRLDTGTSWRDQADRALVDFELYSVDSGADGDAGRVWPEWPDDPRLVPDERIESIRINGGVGWGRKHAREGNDARLNERKCGHAHACECQATRFRIKRDFGNAVCVPFPFVFVPPADLRVGADKCIRGDNHCNAQ